MDDGRFNIVVRATRPFVLLERDDALAYPAGAVEFILDEDELPDSSATEAASDAYAALVRAATDEEPDPQALSALSAYDMAATVEFGLEAKQRLLELRSENARLRLLARLLRAALRRLDFVDRARTRARSNGKVRFG
jgi:Lon protease-like protein